MSRSIRTFAAAFVAAVGLSASVSAQSSSPVILPVGAGFTDVIPH